MKYRNRLKILDTLHDGRYIIYKCLCECGNIKFVKKVSYGHSTFSCGCLRRELNKEKAKKNIKHGMCGTTEYTIWCDMKSRCNNPKSAEFGNYGERGIKVCKEWNLFENFYRDMGDRPSLLHSIDRIDNNKGYEKNNCRWVTWDVQVSNKRSNKFFELNGERNTISQWAKKLNIKPNTLVYRILRGKSFIEAINFRQEAEKQGYILPPMSKSLQFRIM